MVGTDVGSIDVEADIVVDVGDAANWPREELLDKLAGRAKHR